MKYMMLVICVGGILLAGFHDPQPPRRDPVPGSQIVAHSNHCGGCHGADPTGASLVDRHGNDVNMYDDWQVSMMAFSARDPFWRATLTHETAIYSGAKLEIEAACLKCHAPLGSQQYLYDQLPYSYQMLLNDSLGLDGVSCSACHLQTPETYGKSHSGNITFNTDRIIYGPHDTPFEGPMELYVGFTPVFTDLIYSSGVCAGCHTLITSTLNPDGTPSGHHFVEQATYHEWRNSSYPLQGKECQTCHMPFLEDSVIIATGLKGLQRRSPYGMHQFFGANTAMLNMMYDQREALGIPDTIQAEVWEESIFNNRQSLRSSADVSITSFYILSDTLYAEVSIKNNTGHKLPSGYPSRAAWIEVLLTGDISGDTLYINGMLDQAGQISGRDFPVEAHHEISYSADDVQIYEMVMSDAEGVLTTRLNAAYEPLKDNRLLPAGFRRNHSVYDTVAIYGKALNDADYDAFSTVGRDIIEYRIPLNGFQGIADLKVSLRYHTFPARWMEDLFSHDSISEVSQFKSYYEEGYAHFSELLDSVVLEDLDLQPSGTTAVPGDRFEVFPNPVVSGDKINIITDKTLTSSGLCFILTDMHGSVRMSGALTPQITLHPDAGSGLYIITILAEGSIAGVRKIIIL